jgi:pimeloyl-ACP methyl ester carboxylesterase
MTERRFVLAISDALAAKGYAAIAIDLPMHGTRTYCWTAGPESIPDPTTGKLTNLGPPCGTGAACNDVGQCVDQAGTVQPFAQWPVINMPIASGAAFIEVDEIANTRDHFIQAEVDMSSLLRSLEQADWSGVFGRPVDTAHIYYAGESLGGILGGTFVANHDEISRAVLNVPGADTVDLFKDSPIFSGQIAGFFKREGVDPNSFDGHRFLNVARWFMDACDPENFGKALLHPTGGGSRGVLLQMATLDEIIPNAYTKILQAVSGAPRRDYIAEHAFLVIPIEPAYAAGVNDMAAFLNGDITQ